MNLEGFQLLDKEPFDNSIIKRDFMKVYHQKRAQLNDPNQNVKFVSVRIIITVKLEMLILNMI